MKLRVVPSALSLIRSGGIPGLIAVTPGSGFTLDNATAINDNGQIVASGSNAQGQEHAFLLTRLVSAPRIYRPPA